MFLSIGRTARPACYDEKRFMNETPLQVLYLFAGERKKLEAEWRAGLAPDTHLIGFNHLAEEGIKASYAENRFLNGLRKLNYDLTNLFLLPFLFRYDVVFSGASLSLPFFAKAVFRIKTPKFVWYNTFFTNTLKRNRKAGIKRWMIRTAIASLDAVICPSAAQREFLIAEGFDPAKIFFVANGVDERYFDRVPRGAETSATYLLAVGKDMGRDYKTLFAAVEGLPVAVKVIALPRNLKGLERIPENVEIIGSVPFSRLARFYRGAAAVIVPTRSEAHLDASDCSGQYVLLDAMAAGKAVVASRRGTLAEYFLPGREGVIVPPEDPAALRAALADILAHPDRAREMGKRAQERVLRSFTTRRLARDLAALFRRVAASPTQ